MSANSDRTRLTRAATESMEIVSTAQPWRFTVRTEHGVYTVDAQAKTCTCPDFRNRILKLRRRGDRDAACKHLLRVTNGKRLNGATIMRRPRSGRRANDAPSQAQLLIGTTSAPAVTPASAITAGADVGTKQRTEWKEAV